MTATARQTLWAMAESSPKAHGSTTLAGLIRFAPVLALTCLPGVTSAINASANGQTWALNDAAQPGTMVRWADQHPEVQRNPFMSEPAVAAFLTVNDDIAVGDLEAVHQLVAQQFNGAELSYSVEPNEDSNGLMLWLAVETGGLDLAEQMRRERVLHKQIASLPNGGNLLAKQIISVH